MNLFVILALFLVLLFLFMIVKMCISDTKHNIRIKTKFFQIDCTLHKDTSGDMD